MNISYKDYWLWDVCASHALTKELGGGLYDLKGNEIKYANDNSIRNLGTYTFFTRNQKRVDKFIKVYNENPYKLI